MKMATLVIAFVCLILAAYLYTAGPEAAQLKEYKDFFWIPIPIGALLLIYTFFFKGKEEA